MESHLQGSVPLTVVVLTWNEELNIEQCLRSVLGWAEQVVVVDSFSTDHTAGIARTLGAELYANTFEDYATQRNWALDNLELRNEWLLFLDADEYLTDELKEEIAGTLPVTDCEGFFLKRRLYFLGHWIRHGGYYPSWILRLFRRGGARFARGVNEHVHLEGKVGYLQHDFIHDSKKPIGDWIDKHNRYASLEAEALFCGQEDGELRFIGDFLRGTPVRRKKWLRQKFYDRLPLFLRPFLFFVYRYFLRLGFLDGRAGFVYHFLQGFWFMMLIDLKYLELRTKQGD